MARAVWNGSISFGLVSIGVRAHSAVSDHDVKFHQLDPDGSRIRYRKVSEATGEEVDKDDIQMGFEMSKGEYVTFAQRRAQRAPTQDDTHDRSRGLRVARRDRPGVLQEHLLAGAVVRAGGPPLPPARPGDGGAAQGRHRHDRHAQQGVPRGHPSGRRPPRDVDDAVRRRAGDGRRGRRSGRRRRRALRQGTQDGRADHRVAHHRVAARSVQGHVHR